MTYRCIITSHFLELCRKFGLQELPEVAAASLLKRSARVGVRLWFQPDEVECRAQRTGTTGQDLLRLRNLFRRSPRDAMTLAPPKHTRSGQSSTATFPMGLRSKSCSRFHKPVEGRRECLPCMFIVSAGLSCSRQSPRVLKRLVEAAE